MDYLPEPKLKSELEPQLKPQPEPLYAPYMPTKALDFKLLSKFKVLRFFCTDLASNRAMLDAVKEMKFGAVFQFRFWDSEEKACNQFKFVRSEKEYYQVSVQNLAGKEAYLDATRLFQVLFRNKSLINLMLYFSNEKTAKLTRYAWRLPSDEAMDVDPPSIIRRID